MEEIRSTEVLDREILEDARKKALKILKTADDSLEVQKRDWEKKQAEAVGSLKDVYAERLKRTGGEILARLPLDKRRLRAESSEAYLVKAMDDYLRSLTRETLLSILERELRKLLGAWARGEEGTPSIPQAKVLYSGMSLAETKEALKKAVTLLGRESGGLSADKTNPEQWEYSEDRKDMSGKEGFPSIVIDTRGLKLTASVASAAGALLEEKRAELAAALLGEGVLND
ncbi:MAG: ATPase [Treponema sp.]|nr:ATPase [Treponema sp.]